MKRNKQIGGRLSVGVRKFSAKTQKLLAIILACALLVGIVPAFSAFAEEPPTPLPVGSVTVYYHEADEEAPRTEFVAANGVKKDVDGELTINAGLGVFSKKAGTTEPKWKDVPYVDVVLTGLTTILGTSSGEASYTVDASGVVKDRGLLKKDVKQGFVNLNWPEVAPGKWELKPTWFGNFDRADDSHNAISNGYAFGMIGRETNDDGFADNEFFAQLPFAYNATTTYKYIITTTTGAKYSLDITINGSLDVGLNANKLQYRVGEGEPEDVEMVDKDDNPVKELEVTLPGNTSLSYSITLSSDGTTGINEDKSRLSGRLRDGMTFWITVTTNNSSDGIPAKGDWNYLESEEKYTITFKIDDDDDTKLVRALDALGTVFYIPASDYENDAAIASAAEDIAEERLEDAGFVDDDNVVVDIYPGEDEGFLMDVSVGTKGVGEEEIPVVIEILDDLETQLENAVKLIEAQDFIYIEDEEYEDEDGNWDYWWIAENMGVAIDELLQGTKGKGPGVDVSDIVVFNAYPDGPWYKDKFTFDEYVIELSNEEWDDDKFDPETKVYSPLPELLSEVRGLEWKLKEIDPDPPTDDELVAEAITAIGGEIELAYGTAVNEANILLAINAILGEGTTGVEATAAVQIDDTDVWTVTFVKGDAEDDADMTVTVAADSEPPTPPPPAPPSAPSGGGGSAPAAPKEPEIKLATTPKEQVSNVYQVAFGRAADPAGLEHWTALMTTGGWTPEMVITALLNSEEALAQNWTNEQYLTVLYRLLFGRDPDAGGFANWLGFLTTGGKTRAWILERFFESVEWNGVKANFMK